jgi:hypothetical protein
MCLLCVNVFVILAINIQTGEKVGVKVVCGVIFNHLAPSWMYRVSNQIKR